MKYRVGCELKYAVRSPATFVFNVAVRESKQQKIIEEKFSLSPQKDVEELAARPEDNRFHRLNAGVGDLSLSYHAVVEHFAREVEGPIAEVPIESLPAEVISYLYPSRYCPSDKLLRLADRTFGGFNPGVTRVMAICNWIYTNVEYLRGNTDEHTSASETLVERVGVCRDFAHLGISLCRALGIPARFLSAYAYALDPSDFHACFEAYLGHCWYVFDATRLAPTGGFVRIGIGRDAADTSIASIYGDVEMVDMRVFVEPAQGAQESQASDFPVFTTAAVAIS
ncbi:MAG: transglutaminase family protein [Pyrinomonadaceae bacterium]